jgi:hypothetical protein
MGESNRYHDVLSKIAELANSAVENGDESEYDREESEENEQSSEPSGLGCTVKSLPSRLLQESANVAVRANPANGLVIGRLTDFAAGVPSDPQRLAILIAKYWGPTPRRLTVSFMDNPGTDLRNRIISHLNAWTRTGCIEFVWTRGTGQVRISRGPGGYYSYLGTDILLIPRNRQTMNLQGFTMNTPESEFKRVIRHEAGHTLGFPHEHMRRQLIARLDPERTYEYFLRTQGWDRPTVDYQVLTPLEERSIRGTPTADQDSIMCYHLPAEITRDGRPIRGGRDINQSDYSFCGRMYPRAGREAMAVHEEESDWAESEDVEEVCV